MDKFIFETKEGVRDNVEKIAEIFPAAVMEGKVNFDTLRTLLGDEVTGDERYEFTWVGKKEAMREAGRPIRKTLRPCPEESKNWEETENLYIEGDNLEVLKLLQESYLGKIKMVYIDPPYNTGNDFIYIDDFSTGVKEYLDDLGAYSEGEHKLFKNTDSNGRYHSDWCSMMYPRLVMARNLLKDDGVIFISIDDNELINLVKICEQIFGTENMVAIFPWRKRTAKSDVPFGVSQDYEWIMCFSKTPQFRASIAGSPRNYYETDDFPGRPWRYHDLTKQTTASERPNSFFTIINPETGDEYPANPNATWRITKDTIVDYIAKDRIIFPGDYPFLRISKPVLRYWKEDDLRKDGDYFGKIAVSTKLPDDVGMSQDGTKELIGIFGTRLFPFPKPASLIKYLIYASTNHNDVVLDFFAGSSTTAHAVIQMNAEDGKNRRFIMVELPENSDEKSEAYKAGYRNIAEIGKERIRRAGEMIKTEINEENKQVKLGEEPTPIPDIGFRVFKVDESNMKGVYYSAEEFKQIELDQLVSNIKEDRTDMDLLFACLLDWGLPLSMPHYQEEINGVTVHTYNNGDLIACFADNISEQLVRTIASRQPLRAVFRDSSFADSPSKINVEEIFKLLAPNTSIRVL